MLRQINPIAPYVVPYKSPESVTKNYTLWKMFWMCWQLLCGLLFLIVVQGNPTLDEDCELNAVDPMVRNFL